MSVIKLPYLGDGITSASVLSILVKVGDLIQKNQIILDLETEKATAPIPSSDSGTIKKILVKEGDIVVTGTPVLEIELASGKSSVSALPSTEPVSLPQNLLAQSTEKVVSQPVKLEVPSVSYLYSSSNGLDIPTSPYIKKIAKECGIDLGRVQGTAQGGRILIEDVKRYIETLQAHYFQASSKVSSSDSIQTAISVSQDPILPDFEKWGPVTHKPLTTLRKKIGEKMSQSWALIPHVTQLDEIDITSLMDVRKVLNKKYEKKGVKLTVTVFVLKGLVEALKVFPQFNASLDKDTLILKQYFNIGVAVDTENGLIVPVIKDVDKKSVFELSTELSEIALKTRNRQIALEDLQGGTFTLSNLGGFGVGGFTPIVNHPEVAILGTGGAIEKPVYVNKKLEPRLMMPLALSYDHRAVDGADGARFIREVIKQIDVVASEALKG